MTSWDISGWEKYNSNNYPWCYAIAHNGTDVYVEASEQEKNVADVAPHDTGFTLSVAPNRYTYYADGGEGTDIVVRKVRGKQLFNFMHNGQIMFYMDFTNYIQFNNGVAYGWGTNGIKYELFHNRKLRKYISEALFKRIIKETISQYLELNIL